MLDMLAIGDASFCALSVSFRCYVLQSVRKIFILRFMFPGCGFLIHCLYIIFLFPSKLYPFSNLLAVCLCLLVCRAFDELFSEMWSIV